jgi:hypothetical protein
MVLLEQTPDLLLLFPSQFQFLRQAGKFLSDRLRPMDTLELLQRRGVLFLIVLSYGRKVHCYR